MLSHRALALASAIAILAVLAFASAAPAQTDYFWNAPNGGAGTWDTTTQNWSTAAAGQLNYTWTNSGSERANFVNAGGVVTVTGGGITA